MWGQAGAKYTPGMPHMDGYDATARHREREENRERKAKERTKKHVRTKAQLRDKGHINHG